MGKHMEILKEGDRGMALTRERGRVAVVYRYRDLELDSGVKVKNVLVGVDEETDEVLTVPAQSTPKIKRSRDKLKDRTFSVRLPSELDDVLWLVADHFEVNPAKFSPALLRFYLDEAIDNPALVRRLRKLSRRPIARCEFRQKVTLRTRSELIERLKSVAEESDVTRSDLVRGAVIAAKEDVLDGRAKRRTANLKSVAAAI